MINPFLAANLSPHDYAIIGYFNSFNSLILSIISFSFLSYYLRNYYKIREDERQAVLNTLLISQLLLGMIALLFVFVGFYLYMDIVKVNFPFFPYVLLCFIPVFFSCFYNFLLIEKRMNRQALSFFKITLVNTILIALCAIIFVVVLKKGAIGRFWSILIPTVGMGIFSFFKLISKFQFNWKILRDAVVFGWPISLSAVLYYFLSGIDRAMLERLNDSTTFGIYNVAVGISAYLYFFYAAIEKTFEPDIYKAIAENNRKKLIKIITGIIVLNAIPTMVFILLARPVVSILTYGRYTESTQFAQILAVSNIPMAFCFLISNVIIGFGYPKIELFNRAIGAFLSVIMFRFLIYKYGFFGAAWGQSIALVLMTLISALFVLYKVLTHNETHGQENLSYF
jgi:O-antigen/teichoic acid export membrane protein